MLTFIELELEEGLDFLQLSSYDNGTKIDFDLITGKSHEKSKILTMSSDVLVTFTSANIANSARNNTAQRFKFTYTEISDPCDTISPKPLALNKDYSLYIMSSSNKNNADAWIQCAWHLKVDNGSRIEMTAVNFNLETSYDWLYIYDGIDIPSFPKIATAGITANFNSSSLPVDFMRSSSPQLMVQFLSDSYRDAKNFKIKLTTVSCPSLCAQNYQPVCGSDGKVYINQCELDVNSCLAGYLFGENKILPKLSKQNDGNCSESETPVCKEFRLTSTAGIRQYRPELLGIYQLQHKLENERIVYLNKDYRVYLFSATAEDQQFDGSWVIGSYPGDYNTIKAVNPYCRNVNLPANGECTYGWIFIPNDYGARPVSDSTVEIDCLGYTNVVFEDDQILSNLPIDPCGYNHPLVITNTPANIIAPNFPGQISSGTKCDWKVVVS